MKFSSSTHRRYYELHAFNNNSVKSRVRETCAESCPVLHRELCVPVWQWLWGSGSANDRDTHWISINERAAPCNFMFQKVEVRFRAKEFCQPGFAPTLQITGWNFAKGYLTGSEDKRLMVWEERLCILRNFYKQNNTTSQLVKYTKHMKCRSFS